LHTLSDDVIERVTKSPVFASEIVALMPKPRANLVGAEPQHLSHYQGRAHCNIFLFTLIVSIHSWIVLPHFDPLCEKQAWLPYVVRGFYQILAAKRSATKRPPPQTADSVLSTQDSVRVCFQDSSAHDCTSSWSYQINFHQTTRMANLPSQRCTEAIRSATQSLTFCRRTYQHAFRAERSP
jgi:hypothetical protein